MELSDLFKPSKVPHYYGDYTRLLFLAAALVMLVNLPRFMGFLSTPPVFSIIAIIILVLAAGLTNPRQAFSETLNVAISLGGFIIFDFYTVITYKSETYSWYFFYINMLLSVIFLLALYFSVKTLRAKALRDSDIPQNLQ